MTKKKRITISLDDESYKNLIRMKKLRGVTASIFIQDVIDDYCFRDKLLLNQFFVADLDNK